MKTITIENLVDRSATDEYIRYFNNSERYLEQSRELMYDKPTKKQLKQTVVRVRTGLKYQRNEPCLCGSGKKYKKCCLK